MPEHDPVVLAYSHLRDFPRAADALQLLRRVASLVKPLMRARRWKVRELSEFYPDQANLLGLNINKGQKILLRLRYPGDASLFLPLEQVADTLLHELAHIVHGPHDAVFHALWNQLRDEHMALALKGFTGEGFLSEGHRLGGNFDNTGRNNWGATGITSSGPSSSASNTLKRPISMDEARRLARAAAERRQAKAAEKERQSRQRSSGSKSTGHRLGGSSSSPANDMRSVIADAVARRNSHTPETMRGCATDGPQSEYTDQTRKWLADQAARNGFRTQAEEDAANDAAIAQALWELVQEDERQRLGDRYVPPTAERPEGSGGWLSTSPASQGGSSASPIVIDRDIMYVDPPRGPPPQHRRAAPPPPTTRPRPTSMSAVPPGTATRRAPPPPGPKPAELSSSAGSRPRSSSSGAASSNSSRGWTCSICTLHNPSTYLVCDACGVERTSSSSPPKNAVKDGQPSPQRSSHSHSHSTAPPSFHPPPPLAHRPAPPPPTAGSVPPLPRRSLAAQNAAAAASARASAMRQSGQPAKKPRVKKQVRFTPSTRGGSVSSMTSTSSRARPRSPPPANLSSSVDSVVSNGSSSNGGSTFGKILAKHRPAPPPPNQPSRPAPASSSIASSSNSAPSSSSSAPASPTWMCTMCWTNMGRKQITCGSCGKPREAWQN